MFIRHIAGILLIPLIISGCNSTPGKSGDADTSIINQIETNNSQSNYQANNNNNRLQRPRQPTKRPQQRQPTKTAAQYRQEWLAEQELKRQEAEQARIRAKLAAQHKQRMAKLEAQKRYEEAKRERAQEAERLRQQAIRERFLAQKRAMWEQEKKKREAEAAAEAARARARAEKERLAEKARAKRQREQQRAEHQRAKQQQARRQPVRQQQAKRQPTQQQPIRRQAVRQQQPNRQQQARQQQIRQQQIRQQQVRQQQARQQQARQQQPVRVVSRRATPATAGIRAFRASANTYSGPGKFQRLPDKVASRLRATNIKPSTMSAYVRNARGGGALLTAYADKARTPASTMKLVTTYVALGTLGANYRWPTEIYTTGVVRNDTLHGDVIIKGYGDPDFRERDFQTMLNALRARGIRNIAGNLVADRSFFQIPYQDPGAFDGKPKAAYNAQPEALLYNERGSCYEFRNLKGQIQKICPVMPRSKVAQNDLNTNLFGGFWKLWVGKMRGHLNGRFREGRVPQNAQLVHRHHSKPLREIIKVVNKKSNNVMARQLMLAIGAKQMGAPGTPRKGAEAIGRWLEGRGLKFPELRIENGSGLSRVSRISARHLGDMLVDAYNSPYRNDFMNSLAVLGVDGTVRNRLKSSPARGRGKFKTGSLRDVRAIAGYMQAADGQTYVISILHNDKKARRSARRAHDSLIEWVHAGR